MHMLPKKNQVLESIRRNRVALKGTLFTPLSKHNTSTQSLNVQLRKQLDLFANVVRECRGTALLEMSCCSYMPLSATPRECVRDYVLCHPPRHRTLASSSHFLF
jgi:isocitrate/isopropylmalate dehydrogenase